MPACDLTCGSGSTALKLPKRGIRTYAVDLSPGMCRVARRRAREAGLQLRVSRQDIRERLQRNYLVWAPGETEDEETEETNGGNADGSTTPTKTA